MIDLIYDQQQFKSLLSSVSLKASQTYGYTDTEMINDQHNIIFQRLGRTNPNIIFMPTELHASPMYLDMKIVNALHILQQQMSLIERLFWIKKITDSGYIAIWLCVQGEWMLNHLDDQVPYILQQNQSKLVTIQSDQIWPILLEKAIVKVLGKRYEVLNEQVENNVDSILFMLTGFPIQKYKTQELTELSNYFHEVNTLEHIAFVQNKEGICYVIDRIIESDLNHEQLILLNSPNVELVLPTQVKVKQLKQNQFCLTWNEFKTFFDEISILQTYQKYKYYWKELKYIQRVVSLEYSENQYAFKFNLQSSQHCFLTFCQRDQNLYVPFLRAAILYSLVRVLVCQKVDQEFQFIIGDFNIGQNICLEMDLDPGEYYVYVQTYSKKEFGLVEHVNSQQKIIAQLVSNECFQFNDQQYELEELEKQMIIAFALFQANIENTRNYKLQGQPLIQVTTQMSLGLLIFYYKNLGEKVLMEKVIFKQSKNLIDVEAKPPQEFTAELPPNTDFLKVYYYDPLKVFELNQKFSYKLEIESNLQSAEKVFQFDQQKQCDLRSSQVSVRPPPQQTYNESHLVKFLQEDNNARSQQRLYNGEPKDIIMYVYQHAEGVVILYQNNTQEYTLEENIKFELLNLSLKSAKVVMLENKVTIKVAPQSYILLYLEIISKNNAFIFNSDHNYKVDISA